jgi:O-acetylserine/cysteine efflux transporter
MATSSTSAFGAVLAPGRPGVLPLQYTFLAMFVAFIWGTNFVVTQVGLERSPPLLFAALRFCFAAFPTVLFIRRPHVPWWTLIAYGLLIGVGQFGLLFIALSAGTPPGLASLATQLQVLFTVVFAAILFRERILVPHWIGLLVGLSGLMVIGSRIHDGVPARGLVLVILAALSWAGANMVLKKVGSIDMLGFVTWSCVFAAPVLTVLALALDSPASCRDAIVHAGWVLWGAVAWQAYANTLFGYAVWGWLVSRYTAAAVAPSAVDSVIWDGIVGADSWRGPSHLEGNCRHQNSLSPTVF